MPFDTKKEVKEFYCSHPIGKNEIAVWLRQGHIFQMISPDDKVSMAERNMVLAFLDHAGLSFENIEELVAGYLLSLSDKEN